MSKIMKSAQWSVLSIWIAAIFALVAGGTASASTEKIIHSFGYPPHGQGPLGSLIFDSHGNLYGVTNTGGANNMGTVFELTPTASGWTQKVLHSFHGGTDGWEPNSAGLVMDSAGNLYGATREGGSTACTAGCGVIFELKPVANGWSESVIYTFTGGADGYVPSGLVLDGEGNLYGTTPSGGSSSSGTVFELTPASASPTWKKTVLYSFKGGKDGSDPYGGLVFDASGNLYGTTVFGGADGFGTVFELVRSISWTEHILYSFQGITTDTAYPQAALTFDAAGNLFGATGIGGIYELIAVSGGWNESVLFAFSNTSQNRSYIQGGIILDGAGNIFGTSTQNGVFELTHGSGGWTETTLRPTYGYMGGLVFDSAGNLYGADSYITTPTSLGTVFKLTLASGTWTSTTIYNFPNGPAQTPIGSLISDAAGNLYGTAANGGAFGLGVVFELTLSGSTWIQKVLHTFGGKNDGAHPFGSLVFDGSGNLYGQAVSGIFELSPNASGGWTEKTLYTFCQKNGCADGDEQENDAALILDSVGNLYGTTPLGGAAHPGAGTLFKLTHTSSGWTHTVLSSFCVCASGSGPVGGVIFGPSGNLYGVAQAGGGNGSDGGIVYEFNLATNTRTTLYAFRGGANGDGQLPAGGLIFDGSGNLYGTTTAGGTSGGGTVFELMPGSSGWTEKVLYSFKGKTDGAVPYAGVTFDTAGNLYGTTQYGGSSIQPPICAGAGCGTVFKLSPGSSGWTETQLHVFTGGNDGANPYSGVVLDASGNLYGETYWSTTGNAGTVFEMIP